MKKKKNPLSVVITAASAYYSAISDMCDCQRCWKRSHRDYHACAICGWCPLLPDNHHLYTCPNMGKTGDGHNCGGQPWPK